MNEQEVQSAKGAVQSLMVAETGLSLADLSTVFVKSGFFKDVREQSQAIVKVLVGQELGLKPLQSMMGIHIVEGKPELSAALLGVLVKRSGRYDYRVVEHTETACELEFFWLDAGKRESLGTSRFTMEDAARAGLAGRNTWKSYPRNMLHARALSNGVRWYAMDALGLPVYTDGEVTDAREPQQTSTGEVIDITPEPDNPFASAKKEPPDVIQEEPRSDDRAADRANEHAGAEQRVPPVAGAPQRRVRAHRTVSPPSNMESGPVADPGGADAGVGGGSSVPGAVLRQSETPGSGNGAGEQQAGVAPRAENALPTGAPVRRAESEGGHHVEPAVLPGVSPSGGTEAAGSPESVGSEDCGAVSASGQRCWGPLGHTDEHLYEPEKGAPAPPASPDVEPGEQKFMIGDRLIETAGMTEVQFRESLTLGTRIDKDHHYMNKAKWPFGYSRELLRRMLSLVEAKDASRKNLTKAQGEQYLALQRAAADAGSPQTEIPK